MPAKIKYTPGTIIGNNKILKEDIDQTKLKGRTFWICECVNCGNIRSIRVDNLNRNKLCQLCHNKNGKKIKDNLIGKTFGYCKDNNIKLLRFNKDTNIKSEIEKIIYDMTLEATDE